MNDLPKRLRQHVTDPLDGVHMTKHHGQPLLLEAADEIERLTRLIADNVDPYDCTPEDAELAGQCHRKVYPENYTTPPAEQE